MAVVKFKRTQDNRKIITEVDGKRIGNVYCLNNGCHKGHFVKLDYIFHNSTIMIKDKRHRQVSATLIQGEVKINSVLEFLEKR